MLMNPNSDVLFVLRSVSANCWIKMPQTCLTAYLSVLPRFTVKQSLRSQDNLHRFGHVRISKTAI
jgi:hypothetical protein